MSSECYVLHKKTKVSDVGFDFIGDVSLDLFVFSLDDFNELKLVCKYKKISNKNFNYETVLFNFSKSFVRSNLNSSAEVFSRFDFARENVESSEVDFSDNSKEFIDHLFGDNLEINNFESSSSNFLEQSVLFVFFGVVMFVIPMILLW